MTLRSWPTELRFSASKRILTVTYDDEAQFELPYKLLRLESPSADVQGHGNGPKPPPPMTSSLTLSENINHLTEPERKHKFD